MDATHLNCPACGTVRPIRFEPLLRGEPSLGTCVCCAECRQHAFTLLKPARFYCEICDQVQPALLERVEAGRRDEVGVVLVCGGCFDAKAVLYAALRSPSAPASIPNRFAGAAASGRPAPAPPSDRARRG